MNGLDQVYPGPLSVEFEAIISIICATARSRGWDVHPAVWRRVRLVDSLSIAD